MHPANTIRAASRARRLRRHPTLNALIAWLRSGAARRRQRLALLELNDALLKDIGISREQALREGTKPWWR